MKETNVSQKDIEEYVMFVLSALMELGCSAAEAARTVYGVKLRKWIKKNPEEFFGFDPREIAAEIVGSNRVVLDF